MTDERLTNARAATVVRDHLETTIEALTVAETFDEILSEDEIEEILDRAHAILARLNAFVSQVVAEESEK